jgi:hypothetical protein
MKAISATVEADVRANQAAAFEHIVPFDLTSIFAGYGPLPAVTGTQHQVGAWDTAGQTRTVRLSDVVAHGRFALQDVDVENHQRLDGGADGIRTHDLLDAIEARSQLRHGPTVRQGQLSFYSIPGARRQTRRPD